MISSLHLPATVLPNFGYLRTLSVITADWLAQAVEIWQSNSPTLEYSNILDAEVVAEFTGDSTRFSQKDAADLGLPDFYFSQKSQRYHYRESGGFVSKAAVESLTKQSIEQVKGEIKVIAGQLIEGSIELAEWESSTAGALKKLHTWTYLLGRGGQQAMTQSDYGKLGLRLSYEYGYLRGFAEKIRDDGLSVNQFLARLDLYSNKANGTRELALRAGHKSDGWIWEKRLLANADNCSSCTSYAAMGWQPIGSLPAPTESCECQANCLCSCEFSKDLSRPQDSLIKRWGWLHG